MPWRFIGIIIVFIVFLVFIGFNLGEDNRCNINFWFDSGIKDVPVFYTIFLSFTAGVLVTLPVVLGGRKKRAQGGGVPAPVKEKKESKPQIEPDAVIAQSFDEPTPDYSGGKYFTKGKREEGKGKK